MSTPPPQSDDQWSAGHPGDPEPSEHVPLQDTETAHNPSVPTRLPEEADDAVSAQTPRYARPTQPFPQTQQYEDAHTPTVPDWSGQESSTPSPAAWGSRDTAHAAGGPGVYSGHVGAAGSGAPAPTQEKPAEKGRAGVLLSGLAIGAIVGGVVGGGVAAVVAENSGTQTVVQGGTGSSLSLNNVDSATAISGVAAVATPSVVTLEVSSQSAGGSGSGVIYSADGYILTNAHVVTLDGSAADPMIRVKLSDGRILDGELVGTAPYADLAVVKVEAEDLTPVEVGSIDDVNVGDTTVAIGAPLNLANTVTGGVVSALNRGISVGSPLVPQNPDLQDESVPDEDNGYGFPWDFRFDNPGPDEEQQQQGGGSVTIPVIQTDASINPGNSGGALLNTEGQLIGINVAIASAGATAETAGSDGLGFAIPVDLATRVADSIIAGEQPSHGLLGVNIGDSSQDTDADRNFAGGLIVDRVSGGPAEEAGLEVGDVITAVDGVPAADGTSVSALVRVHEGGSEITIDYVRGGERGETTVTLGTLEW